MAHTRVILELWREAERILQELGPTASPVDRSAMESDVAAIRVLYQRAQSEVRAVGRPMGPGSETDPQEPPLLLAIEIARQRHLETVRRLRADIDAATNAPASPG